MNVDVVDILVIGMILNTMQSSLRYGPMVHRVTIAVDKRSIQWHRRVSHIVQHVAIHDTVVKLDLSTNRTTPVAVAVQRP
jgi:hypothetical protein